METNVRSRRRLRESANGKNAARITAKLVNRLTDILGLGSAMIRAGHPALFGMPTVTVVVFTPTCTLGGVTEHVVPLGAPEQDNEAVPV